VPVAISLKYSLLVFGAVLGVIQAAAGYNNLRGLLFFRSRLCTYIFAVIAIGVPLGLFFTWNYMSETGVIAGTEQTGLFVLFVLAAVILTLIISSLTNIRYSPRCTAPPSGLEALRERTFFRIIWEKLTVRNND
jgi:hypothetical protein